MYALSILLLFFGIVLKTCKYPQQNRQGGTVFVVLLCTTMLLGACSASTDQANDASEKQSQSIGETEDTSNLEDSQTEAEGETITESDSSAEGKTNQVDGQVEVHFVDVGQGAAQVIITPNDKVMVIDGGNNDDEQTMVAYLTDLGITKVDILIGTHPDADHIGGLDAVVDAFDVGQIYMPNIQSNTLTFESLLQSIANKGLKVKTAKAGLTLDLDDDVTVKMIAPLSTSTDSNEMSAVVRLQFGEHSFLFTGDAGVETEQALIASGETLESTVLLVGHHGSKHSTSESFVSVVKPTYAVIQVGKNNYGHPEEEVLATLANAGAKIYRNDTDGTIIFMTDGQQMDVNKNAWEYTGETQSQDHSSSSVESDTSSALDVTSAISATATIDNATPNQNQTVAVTVRVTDSEGNPVQGATVDLNLHFKSTDTQYSATTNTDGVAVLSFRIGRAASGYTVNGDIRITAGSQTTTTSTAFTPQ